MKKWKQFFCSLMAGLLLIGAVCPAVSAAGSTTIDVTKKCSLGLSFRSGETCFEGATFHVWKVADMDKSATVTVLDKFAACKSDIMEYTVSSAESVMSYIDSKHIAPDYTAVTDMYGEVNLDVDMGLYVFMSDTYQTYVPYDSADGTVGQQLVEYVSVPCLVAVPTNAYGDWNYHPILYTKVSITYAEPVDFCRVRIVWKDEAYRYFRPDSILCGLYDKDTNDPEVDNFEVGEYDNWIILINGLNDVNRLYCFVPDEQLMFETGHYERSITFENHTFTVTLTYIDDDIPVDPDNPDPPGPDNPDPPGPDEPDPPGPDEPTTPGIYLPITGGMGVYFLYGGGAVLLIIAVVLVVLKFRKKDSSLK